MGLSCFRAISGIGMGWDWDLCAGLFYEHRFAMLKIAVEGNNQQNGAELIFGNEFEKGQNWAYFKNFQL